jgi:hypothetical protein
MNTPQLNSTNASQNQFGWIIGVGFGAVAFGGIALALAPIAVPAIGIGATAIGLGALSSTAIGAGLVATSATIGAIVGVFAEPVIRNFFEDCTDSGSKNSLSGAPDIHQDPTKVPAPVIALVFELVTVQLYNATVVPLPIDNPEAVPEKKLVFIQVDAPVPAVVNAVVFNPGDPI